MNFNFKSIPVFKKRDWIIFCVMIAFLFPAFSGSPLSSAEPKKTVEADLLIVGGTESGCAAAVQAARMGIPKIVIVNDIQWLGGQFTAEALVAIDENRNPQGYGHGVPFPRAGFFKELMDEIEKDNTERYGVPRPGNTRVITTARPAHIEKIFRKLMKPWLDSGQIELFENYRPVSTTMNNQQLKTVRFESTEDAPRLTVNAKLTIDASDWGDVIKKTPAEYEFGPDLKEKYQEPLAPTSRKDYPITDMNPITYCMILEETDTEQVIPQPEHYDRRYYDGIYSSNPKDIYIGRRIVDHYHFKQINKPDALLICYPTHDYPLDVLPGYVCEALEQTEEGASKKNIVEMTPEQRQIIFDDAKRSALGYLHYLQTVIYEKSKESRYNFRRLRLSDEFGTADHLPFKPYIRESLRLKAMYMMKQQDTTGYGKNSNLYASAMYQDGIACWQFEYDFHPTGRKFLTEDHSGPWQNYFRKNRTWGPPYSGRSLFPCRSLIPEKIDGLISAQKNLGYSSIVSSALRLHDQCIAVGQSAGSVAAVSLKQDIQPREIPGNPTLLSEVWDSLCTRKHEAIPHTLWPFRDLEPDHPAFEAINLLAVRQVLGIKPNEVDFKADSPADPNWMKEVISLSRMKKAIPETVEFSPKEMTRGEFAMQWWATIKDYPEKPYQRESEDDADSDGIPDSEDPMPYHQGESSWPERKITPDQDGIPDSKILKEDLVRAFNFTGANQSAPEPFEVDSGTIFSETRKAGWSRDISGSNRKRFRTNDPLTSTFLFTRSHDTWNCQLPDGKYRVTVCIGDESYPQTGQNVTIEGQPVFRQTDTLEGDFREKSVEVEVMDGQLTVEIGLKGSTTNTCLNWLVIQRSE